MLREGCQSVFNRAASAAIASNIALNCADVEAKEDEESESFGKETETDPGSKDKSCMELIALNMAQLVSSFDSLVLQETGVFDMSYSLNS